MASRGGSRRREFSRRRRGGEKQEACSCASEYAYRDIEREECAEKNSGPVVYMATFLADKGRGL